MIRLENVVGRHLLRCGLHGSKVIAHPRKTGKRGVESSGLDKFLAFRISGGSGHIAPPTPSIKMADIELPEGQHRPFNKWFRAA